MTAGKLQSISGPLSTGRLVLCNTEVLQTGLVPVLVHSGPGTSQGWVLRSAPAAVEELVVQGAHTDSVLAPPRRGRAVEC